MTPNEVKARIQKSGATEALMRDVLRSIAAGTCPAPAKCARLVVEAFDAVPRKVPRRKPRKGSER
jgi:hypothetical protein